METNKSTKKQLSNAQTPIFDEHGKTPSHVKIARSQVSASDGQQGVAMERLGWPMMVATG